MRPLSATECISPAIERTKQLLARPFRLGTFLKIAAVAFFAELGGGFSFNLPGRGANGHSLPPAMLAFVVAFAVVLGLIAVVVGLVLFYIGSRLQLTLAEMVAAQQKLVSPVWTRQGRATWRWIGLKVAFFVMMVLVLGAVAAPFVVYFVRHSHASRFPLTAVLMAVPTGLALLLAVIAAYMLLRNFALPPMALEDVTISEALGRIRVMVENEPGQTALFLFLQILLTFVAALGGEMLIAIAGLISLIPFGVVGGGLWLALRHSGPAGMAVLIFVAVVLGLVFLIWIICLFIAVFGSIYVFSQAYALFFLGGRYPLLGNLLDDTLAPVMYPLPLQQPGPMMPYPPPPPQAL